MLSVFILTLLLQRSVCAGCSVDHDEELMNQVLDKGGTKGRIFGVRIQKCQLNDGMKRRLISVIKVVQRKQFGPIPQVQE